MYQKETKQQQEITSTIVPHTKTMLLVSITNNKTREASSIGIYTTGIYFPLSRISATLGSTTDQAGCWCIGTQPIHSSICISELAGKTLRFIGDNGYEFAIAVSSRQSITLSPNVIKSSS
jgi:hypothetical protein